MSTYVLLFDIDMVLADWSHRLPFLNAYKQSAPLTDCVQSGERDNKAQMDLFYAAMPADPVLPGAVLYNMLVNQARLMHKQVLLGNIVTDYPVIDILTCRPEKMRAVTVDWFKRNGLLQPRVMHMRRDDDMRPHHEIKVEMYRKHYERVEEVIAVFDDNAKTIAAFKELGVPCYHVA